MNDDPGRRGRVWALAAPTPLAIVLAVVLGLVGVLVGAEYQRTRTPVFQSSAVVLFDSPAAIDANGAAIVAISQARGKYSGLLATDAIAAPVAASLGLGTGAVEGAVHGVLNPFDLDLVVVAGARTADLAQHIAEATAEQLVTYVDNEQAAIPSSVPASLRLRARVVRPARFAGRISPTHKSELVTGAVAGVLVAILVYVAIQTGADEVKRRRAARPEDPGEPAGHEAALSRP